MSSGFVSGGTSDEPIERDSEWLRVQQDLEAKRKQKIEDGKQEGGKSLYEVLQQNKAAKQEAFEESIRLKNQFRALEDDEVDFLDSVLESTRAKEAAIRQETTAQLDSFRKQQEAVEKAALDSSQETAEDTEARSKSQSALWSTTTKKRRREQDQTQRTALKLRKASSPAGIQAEDGKSTQSSSPKASSNAQSEPGRTSDQPPSSPKVQTSTSTLGLVSYDSDDE